MKKVAAWLPDILVTAGAASVTAGAFLIWLPLGFITLGAALIAAAVITSKGGDRP